MSHIFKFLLIGFFLLSTINLNSKTVFTSENPSQLSYSQPKSALFVTFDKSVTINTIKTYHFNVKFTSKSKGSLTFRNTATGKCQTFAMSYYNEYYLIANVQAYIPAGNYEIIHSEFSSWANNKESGYKGMMTIDDYDPGRNKTRIIQWNSLCK